MLRMSSAKELRAMRLNESPSEKEGKFGDHGRGRPWVGRPQ